MTPEARVKLFSLRIREANIVALAVFSGDGGSLSGVAGHGQIRSSDTTNYLDTSSTAVHLVLPPVPSQICENERTEPPPFPMVLVPLRNIL